MLVYNSSKKIIICEDVKVAKNIVTRSIGLLSKNEMDKKEGLIITPCCSIHTFFMKFDIDVIFVDKKNKVVAIEESVKPNRILPIYLKSAYVLEIKSQKISQKISLDDIIEIR